MSKLRRVSALIRALRERVSFTTPACFAFSSLTCDFGHRGGRNAPRALGSTDAVSGTELYSLNDLCAQRRDTDSASS